MRRLRKLFFYLFLALYLFLTPVAILYARGYIWRPGLRHGLVKTGVVALSSTPDDAQIFLGGRLYARRTPALIRDLLPGEYTLRFMRAGYDDWEIRVRIEPERALAVDRLILLPSGRAWRVVDTNRWDEFYAVPGSPLALIRKGGEFFELDVREPEKKLKALGHLFGVVPHEIIWDRRTERLCYARIGGRIDRVDLADLVVEPVAAPPARRIGVHRRDLYLRSPAGTLHVVSPDGSLQPPGIDVPPSWLEGDEAAAIPDAEGLRWLAARGRELIVDERRENPGGETVWKRQSLWLHSTPIDHAQWAHDDSHVLFSSRGILWLLALPRGGSGAPRAIAALHPGGRFVFDERSGRLFGLDPAGRLVYMTLLPPRALIPFPITREDWP